MTILAVLVLLAGAGVVAAGERGLWRRLARDRRPLGVQRQARRAGLWLLALAHVALAQLGLVLAVVAGADAWAGTATGGRLAAGAAAAGAVLIAAAAVAAIGRPRLSVLAPGVVTAVAQEVLFRGVGLALAVEAGVGTTAAVAVTAAAFAATRLPRGRAPAAAALVAGVLLGAAALVTGTLLVPMALHVAGLLTLAALDRRGWQSATLAAATPGVGCASHDPSSPACLGCPLAPAARAAATA